MGQILPPEARSSEVKSIRHQLPCPQMGPRKKVLRALAWQEGLVPDRGAWVATGYLRGLPLPASHSFGCHRLYWRANSTLKLIGDSRVGKLEFKVNSCKPSK